MTGEDSRKWSPEAVVVSEPFHLDENGKGELLRICQRQYHPNAAVFIHHVEKSIGHFRAFRKHLHESTPANVRERLDKCSALARQLIFCIQNFDALSRQMLSEQGFSWPERAIPLHREFVHFLNATAGASAEALKFPNARLPDYAKYSLAYDVARFMHDDLGLRPGKSRDGKYAKCLGFVLEKAEPEKGRATDLFRTVAVGIAMLDTEKLTTTWDEKLQRNVVSVRETGFPSGDFSRKKKR